MRKFVKTVLIYFVIAVAIICGIAFCIDPYNVLHWKNIRNNGVEPNKNYIKTRYLIENPDKFDSYILGSSRVGAIHTEKITGERVYNLTYSEGTPTEQFETIKCLIDSGVNIKNIYIGVDSLSYTLDAYFHRGTGMHSTYMELKNPIKFLETYFNPNTNIAALETIRENSEIAGFDSFYEYGWDFDYGLGYKEDWEYSVPSIGTSYRFYETLDEISQIKSLCEANGIGLILWTNPMYITTYEESVNQGYLFFLEELAKITGFYNFSGINDITTDYRNYLDSSHYNAEVGDMMIDVIWSKKQFDGLYEQGFGVYVDKSN